ncbi:glycosyl transferase group 1 [Bacteroides coprosuis DSM 18011]|uniref:Glycosyl transferase group 1 n=1 Tax=Bacteroides coprosuis DSM 18011 TaxID=679937 RepID=F3ZS28_9BACE|nr:glycosyltransferase [Bacteroides coprosuis]EGJ72049.1 glycosyl transferase group 1 [Bacteroides coprosuis DSM 18011]
MKILLVNCVFGFGSTGKIMLDLCRGLIEHGHEVKLCFGRGKQHNSDYATLLASPFVQKIQSLCSKFTGRGYECAPISTHHLFSVIKEWKPDVVNLHCVNANSINVAETISFLKENNIATVISNHAEFLYTGGCGHALSCEKWKIGCNDCEQIGKSYSMLPYSFVPQKTHRYWMHLQKAYSGFGKLIITGVSPWLVDRISDSPFFKSNQSFVVGNGLNTDVFSPRNYDYLLEKHQLTESQPILLHVTPNFFSPIKGGKYVLEIAKEIKESLPEAKIIIVGYRGDTSNLPENVIPVAFTKDQRELADYYTMANLTLLTSERETFSMVCAESLCCGTPVVGFKAGAPETISIKEYSRFVDYANVKLLHDAIIEMIKYKKINTINIEKSHYLYSVDRMVEGYLKCYIKVYKSEDINISR